MMKRKTVGIIGGMGPHSTIRLFEFIVERTPINSENDHLHILIDNRPQIPDRTAAILGQGPSPVPALKDSARLLENWGAEVIAIACNTAHYFWNEVQQAVTVPVLNMIKLVAQSAKKIGQGHYLLLATTGTVQSGLYQRYFPPEQIIVPEPPFQQQLMDIIYGKGGVKHQGPTSVAVSRLLKIIRHYHGSKLVAIIAGCTEIELLLSHSVENLPVIKPLEILADAIVQFAISES